MTVDRRQFLTWSALGSMALSFPALPAMGQSNGIGRNHFPRMVQNYYVKRVRDIDAGIRERIFSLETRGDAERYVQQVRGKIMQAFGLFPEKTPLKARITGTIDREQYRIENVIFESRPGFLVTANLYLPQGRNYPVPGVVGTCGHSSNGKAYEGYQSFAQGLARQGYAVLLYDPIGQGERLQYVDEELNSTVGVGVREHLKAGNLQYLVGESIATWRAWDGIRALDYLLSRDEVDSTQVGVTGNSGGGTMTTWLCGVEERWNMGAPSCFVTTFLRNLENELPADTEQCPPGVLALGLDHADFIAAMAPKPVILLAKEKDYFDVRGTEEAHRRLKHIYSLLGAPDNVGMFVGPTYHGYSQENREAMYQWFNDVTEVSEQTAEPTITVEDEQDLWCTPKGQVAAEGSRSVFSFTAARAKQLNQHKPKYRGKALQNAVLEALGIAADESIPQYRILRAFSNGDYPRQHVTPYAIESEPGVFALVYRLANERHYSRPPQGLGPAVLYVCHQSSDAELKGDGLIVESLRKMEDVPIFSCDVRGVGESAPQTCGRDINHPYGPDYFYAAHGLMLNDCYVAQKTRDLLAVLRWLNSYGYDEVLLMANGWGTVPATFAAVLSDTVSQVALEGAMDSYASVAQTEDYEWPLSAFVPGIVGKVDLDDCYKALGERLTMY